MYSYIFLAFPIVRDVVLPKWGLIEGYLQENNAIGYGVDDFTEWLIGRVVSAYMVENNISSFWHESMSSAASIYEEVIDLPFLNAELGMIYRDIQNRISCHERAFQVAERIKIVAMGKDLILGYSLKLHL